MFSTLSSESFYSPLLTFRKSHPGTLICLLENFHSPVWNNAQHSSARDHTQIHLQTTATSSPGNPFKQASNKTPAKRKKAENWITTSPSFPLFSPLLPLSSLHVRQRDSFLLSSEKRANPTADPHGEKGGVLPWGGGT